MKHRPPIKLKAAFASARFRPAPFFLIEAIIAVIHVPKLLPIITPIPEVSGITPSLTREIKTTFTTVLLWHMAVTTVPVRNDDQTVVEYLANMS